MKLKKTLGIFIGNLKNRTEKEVQTEVLNLLESYELKIKYGAKNKLIAFSNSIHTPKSTPDFRKEITMKLALRRQKNPKANQAYMFKNEIEIAREEGKSHESIAKELSDKMVKYYKYSKNKKPYFNKTYIVRFCQDYFIP